MELAGKGILADGLPSRPSSSVLFPHILLLVAVALPAVMLNDNEPPYILDISMVGSSTQWSHVG